MKRELQRRRKYMKRDLLKRLIYLKGHPRISRSSDEFVEIVSASLLLSVRLFCSQCVSFVVSTSLVWVSSQCYASLLTYVHIWWCSAPSKQMSAWKRKMWLFVVHWADVLVSTKTLSLFAALYPRANKSQESTVSNYQET